MNKLKSNLAHKIFTYSCLSSSSPTHYNLDLRLCTLSIPTVYNLSTDSSLTDHTTSSIFFYNTYPIPTTYTMADVATNPPSAEVDKKGHSKPEKPDEDAYKSALKAAEKEHADSMAKFVS